MKTVNLSTKGLIILVGPTASGKTTFANRIKNASPLDTIIISGDEIIKKIDPNQSDEEIDKEFRFKFLDELKNIKKPKDKFIVFDIIHLIRNSALENLLFVAYLFTEFETITIIKFDLPLELQIKYAKQRELSSNIETYSEIIMSQRETFYGSDGSFYIDSLFCREIVITNPEETKINICD